MTPVQANQISPRLTLYSQPSGQGDSVAFHGNLGVADTDEVLNRAQSLRFFSSRIGAMRVVFSEPGFQGKFRICRGSASSGVNLSDLIAGQRARSIISTNDSLTQADVREISRTGKLPDGYRMI